MRYARTIRAALGLALAALAAGCLEVEQHPPYVNGQYDGKPDNLPEQAYFHGDRFAWQAAALNRQEKQNEYNRIGHERPSELSRVERERRVQ